MRLTRRILGLTALIGAVGFAGATPVQAAPKTAQAQLARQRFLALVKQTGRPGVTATAASAGQGQRFSITQRARFGARATAGFFGFAGGNSLRTITRLERLYFNSLYRLVRRERYELRFLFRELRRGLISQEEFVLERNRSLQAFLNAVKQLTEQFAGTTFR